MRQALAVVLAGFTLVSAGRCGGMAGDPEGSPVVSTVPSDGASGKPDRIAYAPVVDVKEEARIDHRPAQAPGIPEGVAAASSLGAPAAVFDYPVEPVESETCLDCHTEAHEKAWPTREAKLAQNCESCHGSGAAHIEDPETVKFPLRPHVTPDTPAETCLACHELRSKPMHEWEKSPHKTAGLKCAQCHTTAHDMERTVESARWSRGTDKITGACLTCHHQEDHVNFKSSPHGLAGLACNSCHKPNNAIENTKKGKANEVGLCLMCHQDKRGQINMPSHHPIPEGKMTCTGCHSPHGSPTGDRMMLVRESVNETCLKCHQNHAGPWTFEHPPAAEDCLSCHRSHGSVTHQLLVQPEDGLCLRCHRPQHGGFADRDLGGVGFPADGLGLSRDASLQRWLAYQMCTHCHVKIHGSDQDHGFTH